MHAPHLTIACRRQQRGAALLTAMIIVTLVATLAASMVWQQWRAVQVETAERARTQAAWILSGALDFAKLILKETVKQGRPTALTDPWATPLAEARLSTFLAVDKSNADDGPEAFLSGYITDAQGRYNLNNLLVPVDNKPDPLELETLERLCQTAGVDASVAARIASGLRDAKAGTSAAAPLRPLTVQQLTWLGIDAASVRALEPYVVLLPEGVALNVNTASREVLAAVVKGLDLGTAGRLVTTRDSSPFKDTGAFFVAAGITATPAAKLTTASIYFDVYGRLRLVDRVLVERSLLSRAGSSNGQFKVLHSERVASLERAGG